MLLLIDALIHPYAFFDVPVINAVQTVEHEHARGLTAHLAWLTGAEGAILSWLLVLVTVAACRWWSATLVTLIMPVGGLLNTLISDVIVSRTRPHLSELVRGSTNWEEGSFPSGHVMGAVILYGFVFFLATRLDRYWVRVPLQVVSLAVLVSVGVGRIWQGAHWPTDVLAAYALGGMVLIGLVALERHLRTHPVGEAVRALIKGMHRPVA